MDPFAEFEEMREVAAVADISEDRSYGGGGWWVAL